MAGAERTSTVQVVMRMCGTGGVGLVLCFGVGRRYYGEVIVRLMVGYSVDTYMQRVTAQSLATHRQELDPTTPTRKRHVRAMPARQLGQGYRRHQ